MATNKEVIKLLESAQRRCEDGKGSEGEVIWGMAEDIWCPHPREEDRGDFIAVYNSLVRGRGRVDTGLSADQ